MPKPTQSNAAQAHTPHIAGMTALVTGGTGFIGTRLCMTLREAGLIVHSAGRRATGGSVAHRHWQIDLTDAVATRQLLESIHPEYVFHLASHVMGSPDLSQVLPTFHGNLQTTVNLLTAVASIGCGRVIMTGSLVEPESRDTEHTPSAPYAAAKWASSDYARMFHALYGVPVVIARVFMVYGPGQHDASKLVPYVINSVLAGRAPQLTSGHRLVDWVFVDDVAEGLARLAQADDVEGLTVDLGSGTLIGTIELVKKICELMGTAIQPCFGALADRPLEPIRTARVDETLREIGWAPRISLEDGLLRTIDWYREQSESTRHG